MATAVRIPSPDDVLLLARALQNAHDSRQVSTKHLALAELISVTRMLPADARYEPVAPLDEVRRQVGDGAYTLTTRDGALVMQILDAHGDDTTHAYTPEQVRALIADLSAVLASIGGRCG